MKREIVDRGLPKVVYRQQIQKQIFEELKKSSLQRLMSKENGRYRGHGMGKDRGRWKNKQQWQIHGEYEEEY